MNRAIANVDAERALLGSVLIAESALATALDAQLTADDFSARAHQLVFGGMVALARRSEPIDTVTLKAELDARGELAAAGGLAAIVALSTSVPSPANASYYAREVRSRALRR